MHFAFYDLETTGISPAFDQPLQFAAILTDGKFREIERVNLRCRIAPHIIPSPWALAVTGIRPAQLVDPELPSLFKFTQEISALIERWSPAIWTVQTCRMRELAKSDQSITAVASISIRASSSTRPDTTTIVIAGKCLPNTRR